MAGAFKRAFLVIFVALSQRNEAEMALETEVRTAFVDVERLYAVDDRRTMFLFVGEEGEMVKELTVMNAPSEWHATS